MIAISYVIGGISVKSVLEGSRFPFDSTPEDNNTIHGGKNGSKHTKYLVTYMAGLKNDHRKERVALVQT